MHERVGVLVAGDIDEGAGATVAGTRFFGLYIAVRRSSRSSGTFEMPMLTSPLPRDASTLVMS